MNNDSRIEILLSCKLCHPDGVLIMISRKWQMTEGTELPDQEKIWTLREKETYKYLGILEANTTKQVEMKEIILKEYLSGTRKLLETKLYSRDLIKGINTWAIFLVRYSGPFLKWTKEEPNRPENKKTNYHAKGLTSQRWRWQIVCFKKRWRKWTCQHWI